MTESVKARPLTANEEALLRKIVRALHQPGAGALAAQVGAASVEGGVPTRLDLSVGHGVEPASIEDGPLPVRAFVVEPQGEILVWIKSGYLDGLEFAWTCDDTPTEMPDADATMLEP